MTRYWCGLALLPGGPARDVTFTVDGGRFTDVTPGTAPADATRLPGVVLPGFADAHSPRLPPGAARPHARRRAARSGPGGERMYAVAGRLDPDCYLALARAAYAEMALAGVTAVGEFHYLHHAPGGRRYADPNAMGEALVAGRRRGRHPADPARHLLPGRRLRRRARRSTASSGGSPTATPTPGRTGSARCATAPGCGSAPRSTRSAPCRGRRWAPSAAAAGGRPLHVHLSEQPARERGLPGRLRLHPRPACWPPTAARPARPPPCTPPT